MTSHTAKFSNGETRTSTRRLPYKYAWFASGTIGETGSPWRMSGFSTSDVAGAKRAMMSITAHLRVGGGTMDFAEVVEATAVEPAVSR